MNATLGAAGRSTHPRVPSRTQQVRTMITDYILREGIKAGEPIPPESKLIELTGASRSAVREALKVMEALGFV